MSSRGYQLISSRWKTPRIKFAFYVFVHKKNKFRLLFFFRLNFKNKNREHIYRNRHKYVFSRIFGEYKYAWFILVYIFIFHEYHRIHIASNRYPLDLIFTARIQKQIIYSRFNGHEYKNMTFIFDTIIFLIKKVVLSMKIKEQYILMILIYYGGHQPDKVYLLLVASPGKML